MKLSLDIALNVFQKIRNVQDEIKSYVLAGDRAALPVSELRSVIGRMYQLQIEIAEVPYQVRHVRGMVLRYADRSVIYVGKNQPNDWQRFAIAKELCHLMNDEKEDWSADGAATISDLLNELHFDNEVAAERASQSEIFAELAAIELLYPYQCRLDDVTGLNDGTKKLTEAKIANYHEIPEEIVLQALGRQRMSLAQHVWEALARNATG